MPTGHLRITSAAVGCAVALAACGGSSHNSTNGGSGSKTNPGIEFADCMRAHGVTNFPDPGAGGGIQIPTGANPNSPAFQSAQNACMKLLPAPPSRGPGSESRKLQLLRLAQCMRRHGLTTFPDPVSSPPSPSAGFGIAFGAPGAFIAVPQTMIQSPGFQQAAAACGFPGAGRLSRAKATPAP